MVDKRILPQPLLSLERLFTNWIRFISKTPALFLIPILLVYCTLLLPTVARQGISWDEQTDIEIARAYIDRPGGWFIGSNSDPSQTRLPMYIVALVYALTGRDDLLSARFMSAFIGGVTIVGVYIFCEREFDWRRGIFAAAILAASPFFLSFARTAFTETDIYAACAFVWLLVVTSNLQTKRTIGAAGITAIILGLALSAKFTAVFLLPAFLIYLKSWSYQDLEPTRFHPRDSLGIAGPTVLLFSVAWFGWNNVSFATDAENDGAVAGMHYLLAGILWLATLIWVIRRFNQKASPLFLGALVVLLAMSTFMMIPPVHLTNPEIVNSLLNRFDSEMRWDVGFMQEAIGVHLGSVIFKSSPLLGLGLLIGLVGASLQSKHRKMVQFPLLMTACYFLGLIMLPIAQTFYMMPLLPILAILCADQWFRLLANRKLLALLIGGATTAVLILDLIGCYPDYNLNGYQWLGSGYILGRPTIGYRSIVQTTSDGVQQTIQWVCDRANTNDRVVAYVYPWHIVEATCPDPSFVLVRGNWESNPRDPDYVIIHINHTIRAKWSAWFSGWENNKPADSIFWEPYDAEWLHTNYVKVYSVQRAFDLEMASVWQRE